MKLKDFAMIIISVIILFAIGWWLIPDDKPVVQQTPTPIPTPTSTQTPVFRDGK